MILYNASTSNGLRNFARRFSNSNTSNYSNADLDASINAYYDVFVTEILKSMDDWDFNGEIATTSMVAGQQEYTFPSDILKVKSIEVTYDGVNWRKATKFDINEKSTANNTASITRDFTVDEPYVDIHDDGIFLFPVPSANSTNGIKIYYEKLPTQLSAVTDEPTIPRPFHIGLAYGAAKDWLEQFPSKENATRLSTATNNLNITLARTKDFFTKRDQDRDYVVSTGYVEYDYGND